MSPNPRSDRPLQPRSRRAMSAVKAVVLAGACVACAGVAARGDGPQRPNVVWIVVEDMSAHFGCYGERTIATPYVDALAAAGTRFDAAFVTAPVCSTARSAMITGMYQTSIGAHHHRSGRGELKINLPQNVVPLPVLMQQAGYYTVNMSYPDGGVGKTDYNFEFDPKMYSGPDWRKRANGQPFFAQIQLHGGKSRGGNRHVIDGQPVYDTQTSPNDVRLPPYYPDHPVLRKDWAEYLDSVRYTDALVGHLMKRLRDEGLIDTTVVMFMTDHGVSHARGKQFCYDEGMRVPLIVAGPGIDAGKVREDLVEHIDMAAETLRLAGIERPDWMQARPLFGEREDRAYVVSARDRCDETVDRIRAVRTARYKYIRNGYPDRPHLSPNNYKDTKPFMPTLKSLHAEGKLNAAQSSYMGPTRPGEELYDLSADPWELSNLADDAAHAAELGAMRKRLAEWIQRTGDLGQQPEPAAMYDSDMAVYIGVFKGRRPETAAAIERNIEQMKRWDSEGK